MASELPCPNPVCTHVFAPEEVQSAAALRCPQCGQVFQFRAGPLTPDPSPPQGRGEKPPTGNPERAKSKRTVPIAAPVPPSQLKKVAPNIPVAAPVAPRAADVDVVLAPVASQVPMAAPPAPNPAFHTGDGPLIQTRVQRGGWTTRKLAILGVGLLAGVGVVAGGLFLILNSLGTKNGDTLGGKGAAITFNIRNQKNAEEKAFKLIVSEKDWQRDGDMRQRMGVTTAWKNISEENPKPGWFAVAAKDYGFAKPREAELLRLGIEKLEQYFGEAFELEAKAEPAQLCEQEGQRLLFKAQKNSVVWWGHMYMLAQHGFGYWFYIAAPTKEEAEDAFKDLQSGGGGFVLFNDRRGWREQPAKMDQFTTDNGAFTVAAPEGVWEKHTAKDFDERGELYLFGRFQQEKDNRKNASILVFALD
ncbi:MAG: hypothetical protein L0Y70_25910, partial [Gemmataceae bacterium]|nr:hypothetical protein [Gemmataceae bacterium]